MEYIYETPDTEYYIYMVPYLVSKDAAACNVPPRTYVPLHLTMPLASIVTIANMFVLDYLRNFVAHHVRLGQSAPQLHVFNLDNESFQLCSDLVTELRRQHCSLHNSVACHRPDCCTDADARGVASGWKAMRSAEQRLQRLREAVLTYKLVAVAETLASVAAPVFLLDLDAFVLRRECFDEWLQYGESMVVQPGGAPGCPTGSTFEIMGFSINTGAMLFRPEAERFLRAVLLQRSTGHGMEYQNHCYEQELFVRGVLDAQPSWIDFPSLLHLTGADDLSMRLLNYSRWAAGPSMEIWRGRLPHSPSSGSTPSTPSKNVRFRVSCAFHDRQTFRPTRIADPCSFKPLVSNKDICLYHAGGLDPGTSKLKLLSRYQLWYNTSAQSLLCA